MAKPTSRLGRRPSRLNRLAGAIAALGASLPSHTTGLVSPIPVAMPVRTGLRAQRRPSADTIPADKG